ncbi:hypothetical protein [uncultured Streptomyces sp.]|uniref:hypothetical protein n=1 Tax=uncultured Streptomyces sp. TaxID=174707 RepID=UPI0026277DB7|nr:hypothetical protein [uncultured Streptomyces sp.]
MAVRQHGQQHRHGKNGVRALAALAAAGVVAVAAGCSAPGGDMANASADGPVAEQPAAVLGRAADVLAEAGGAETRTSMETSSGGTRVTIRGQGTYDFRRQTGSVKVVLPKDPAGTEKHRPITELLAPGALYMMNRGAGVPDGKWVKVETAGLADGNLVTGGVTDPTAAAELLRGASGVREVGATELAGVKVRHYRGTADIGRAAAAASPLSRDALTAAAKGFSTDAVPFDAYLDEEGRLRKVRHRFRFSAQGPQVTVVSTLLLYGFGMPVEVELPDDADIYTGEIQQG